MENIQISHTYILVPYSAHTDTVSNVCTYFALWFLFWELVGGGGGGAASHGLTFILIRRSGEGVGGSSGICLTQ